jgi:hypothetical protein
VAQQKLSLVVDVAADISQIRGQLDTASNKISSFASGATKALGALGLGLSAVGIASFALDVANAAGEIVDLSKKTDLSIESVQRYKAAIELSGGTIEDVAKSIQKMSVNLAGGNSSAVGALKEMNLNVDKLRQSGPDQAFRDIWTEILKIPDPMKQSEMAMRIFGKAGLEVLPAMRDGFLDNAEAASVMSDETALALDEAMDNWGKFKNQIIVFTGEILGAVMKTPSTVESSWKLATSSVKNGAQFLYTAMTQGTAVAITTTTAVQQAADATTKHGEEQKKAAPKIGKTTEEIKEQEAAQKKAADAAKRHTEEVTRLADQLTGKSDIKEAKLMLEALAMAQVKAADVTKLSEEQQKKVNTAMGEAIAAYERTGKVAPAVMNELYVRTMPIPPVINGIAKEMRDLGKEVEVVAPVLLSTFGPKVTAGLKDIGSIGKQVAVPTFQEIQAGIKKSRDEADKFNDTSLRNLAQSFTQLSTISDGAMGSVGKATGQVTSTFLSLKDGTGALNEGMKGIAKGGMTNIIGGVAGMVSGIGAYVAAAQLAWKGLNKLFGNEGRDLVKDYAATFVGGFDGPGGMHEALLRGGAAGEALWVRLTQGTGRNNPTEAKKNIADVQAFLENLKNAEVETARAAAEAHTKAMEDIDAKYAETLNNIDSERKSLLSRIAAEAPEEVMGVMEQMDRLRLAELDREREAVEAKKAMEVDAANEAFKNASSKAEATRNEIQNVFNRGVELPVNYVIKNSPGGVPDVPEFATGSNGLRDFGSGTLAMLHNREAVLTEGQYNALRSGGGGDIHVHVAPPVGADLGWAMRVGNETAKAIRTNLQMEGVI